MTEAIIPSPPFLLLFRQSKHVRTLRRIGAVTPFRFTGQRRGRRLNVELERILPERLLHFMC